MSDALTAIEVFCSCAHEDLPYLQRLKAHLSVLEQQGLISIWHNHQIGAGTDRAQAIDSHLETASLILFLISSDFLASYKAEIQRAIERHKTAQARVLPIIVRPCDWNHTPLAGLQSLPLDGQPVTTWDNQDLAWNDVASGIRRAVEDLSLLATYAPQATFPSVWDIPYPRNPFFIGRDNLLSRLHTQLQKGQPTAISQPQAISGLGGIGKTHVAIEYAYQYRQEYQTVLWARAENQETLTSSYKAHYRLQAIRS